MSPSADPPDDAMTDWSAPARLRTLPTRLLNHAGMYAERLVNDAMAQVDARKWHYAVLVSLQEYGPMSQATLSRRTGMYRSDLVGLINELADGSYVERAPDPADRRRNVITITQQGRRRLRQLEKVVAAIEEDLLAPLTQAEREQLIRTLTRIVDNQARKGSITLGESHRR
jgi:DNA-binding MarR family transcriptional regulator